MDLAIEFWFYVTFPFLLWAATLTGRVLPCIGAGIAISLAAKVFHFGGVTLHYYDHFLIGSMCAAAIKLKAIPSFARWPRLFAAASSRSCLSPPRRTRNAGLTWFCQSLGAATAAALVIISGHVRPPTISVPSLAFLGRISYSVYLMHAVVLDVFVFVGFDMAHFQWVFVASALAVSTFTYYVIEMPIERQAHLKIRYGLTEPLSS